MPLTGTLSPEDDMTHRELQASSQAVMTAPANKQLNARGGVRCPQQRRLGPPRVFTDYARRRRAKPTPRSLSVIHTQTRMRLATQSAGATAPTRSEHPHPPPRAAWSGAQQGGFGGAPTVRADERRPWWAIQRWAAGVRKVTPAYTHGCYSPPQGTHSPPTQIPHVTQKH